jgi:hypothetical protein
VYSKALGANKLACAKKDFRAPNIQGLIRI